MIKPGFQKQVQKIKFVQRTARIKGNVLKIVREKKLIQKNARVREKTQKQAQRKKGNAEESAEVNAAEVRRNKSLRFANADLQLFGV